MLTLFNTDNLSPQYCFDKIEIRFSQKKSSSYLQKEGSITPTLFHAKIVHNKHNFDNIEKVKFFGGKFVQKQAQQI